jgi:hypothetical protein
MQKMDYSAYFVIIILYTELHDRGYIIFTVCRF